MESIKPAGNWKFYVFISLTALVFFIALSVYFHLPVLTAIPIGFLFGFFFGAIVVPCNPLFISALFTRNVLIMDFAANMVSFLSLGLGIAFPLLLFSAISSARTIQVMGFLSSNKRRINLISGVAMLAISLYYLVFVFRVFG